LRETKIEQTKNKREIQHSRQVWWWSSTCYILSLRNKWKAICTNTIYAALTQILKEKGKDFKKRGGA